MYILDDGERVKFPYGLSQLRKDNPKTSFPDKMPDERLTEYGVLPVVTLDIPVFNKQSQTVITGEPKKVGAQWVIDHEVIDRTVDEIRPELKAQLYSIYQQKRNSGIDVDGKQIQTTADAVNELIAAKTAARGTRKIVTKAGDRMQLTQADIDGMIAAIDAHIQKCNDRYYDLHEEIDNTTTAAKLAAIELDEGW
jgi:hypothetical protein